MEYQGPHTYTGPVRFLNRLSVSESSWLDGQVTVNDSGKDVDFRVESDNDANALFVQGSDGFIGIGTSSPDYKLQIIGNNDDKTLVHIGDDDDDTGMYLLTTQYGDAIIAAGMIYNGSEFIAKSAEASCVYMDEGNIDFYGNTSLTPGSSFSLDRLVSFNHDGAVFNESSHDLDFRIESDTDANAFFLQGSDGFVGLGTNAPSQILDIYATSNPRIEISDASNEWEFGMSGNNLLIADVTNTKYPITLEPNMSATIFGTAATGFRVGDTTTNYITFGATGDQTFTGSAGFYPRTLSQDGEPAAGTGATQIDSGEMIFWVDTNDSNRRYMVYNHGGTVVLVELT